VSAHRCYATFVWGRIIVFGDDYTPKQAIWIKSLVLHYLIAVVVSMIVGFLPEIIIGKLYYNTGLEPYSPLIALTAFLLGYFVSLRVRGGRAATFVWTLGLCWMLFGIYDTASSWSPLTRVATRWEYVLNSLFGPASRCSGSECLGELVFTTPFTASVTYSMGAYFRKRRSVMQARPNQPNAQDQNKNP
jgi:hypothetical protein